MAQRAKRSLQVRTECIEQVKLALARNGYFSQKDLATETEISLSTVSNFLNGKPVSREYFHELCDRLNLNWQDITDLAPATLPTPQPPTPNTQPLKQDWGEAIDVSEFYGRTTELTTLQQWIIADKCRLIALLGMGGIGKTALSVKLAKTIANQFDFVIWRSLRESPPVDKILTDLIKILSHQQETDLPDSIGEKITKLIEYLNSSRCLLVLDNAESILQGGSRAGHYRPEYEDYGSLCQRIGSSAHQSCLLITSREKPKEIATLEGTTRPVRTLPVMGLQESAQEIMKAKGVRGSQTEMARLTEIYSGNPLAINIVATSIQDLFAGDLATFLSQDVAILGDIAELLDSQFNRLPEFEQEIMYWLAINREPVSCQELREDIVPQPVLNDLLASLERLRRRSLIERVEEGFTLQNVVMEYMTGKLIAGVRAEILQGEVELFHGYALLKATAKDYVRETQIRLIVQPVVAGISDIQARLTGLLAFLRRGLGREAGYGAGNVLNLLACLDVDLAGYDFSDLSVKQAYLQGKVLHGVSFAEADIDRCVFNKIFGAVMSVAFSPDGKLIAAGDTNGRIRLWQVTNSQPFLILQGHRNWVRSIAFHPDGQTLASGSSDGTVKLWDVNTAQCLHTFQEHKNRVQSVAFSPHGKILASSSSDQTVKLWDVNTAQCLHTFQEHDNSIHSVAFSPNSKMLVSGGADQTIKLWDVASGQCLHTLYGHIDWLQSVAFSPDGKILASGSNDQTIKLWDVHTAQCLHTFQEHKNRVESVAFSPNGNILASGSEDQTIKLWDVHTGKCLHTLQSHSNWVWSVAFSPDGKTFVSGSADQTIKLWDVHTGKCLQTLYGHSNRVLSATFSSDGNTLASSSNDYTIKLWDVHTGKCLHSLQGHDKWVWSVVFSPDGKILASVSGDQTIKLWDVNTSQCLHTLHEHSDRVLSGTFSTNGKILASGSADQTIKLWDVNTSQCLHTLHGHSNWILSVVFSSDGKILASGSGDQTVKLWDVNTGKCLHTLQGHNNRVRSVVFSSDGKTLASGSADQTVKLWDVNTGKCLNTLQLNSNWVWSVPFSCKNTTIASSISNQTFKLWDVISGRCLHTLYGHSSWVFSIFSNSHCSIIASRGIDETIKIWDIETGKCLKTLLAPRPYEAMNITRISGISEAQKANLKALGAVEEAGG